MAWARRLWRHANPTWTGHARACAAVVLPELPSAVSWHATSAAQLWACSWRPWHRRWSAHLFGSRRASSWLSSCSQPVSGPFVVPCRSHSTFAHRFVALGAATPESEQSSAPPTVKSTPPLLPPAGKPRLPRLLALNLWLPTDEPPA